MVVASVGVGKMMQKGKLSYGIHEFIFRPMTPEASYEAFKQVMHALCVKTSLLFLDNHVDGIILNISSKTTYRIRWVYT